MEKVIDSRYLSLLEGASTLGPAFDGSFYPADRGRNAAVTVNYQPGIERNNVSKAGYLPHNCASLVSAAPDSRAPAEGALQQGVAGLRVQAKLKKKWSPEQISNRLSRDFP